MTPREADCLAVIRRQQNPTNRTIAAELHITQQSVERLVRGLRLQGHVALANGTKRYIPRVGTQPQAVIPNAPDKACLELLREAESIIADCWVQSYHQVRRESWRERAAEYLGGRS